MVHQFKVGDKVKTRDGRDAHVVADGLSTLDGRTLAVVFSCEGSYDFVALIGSDGRVSFSSESSLDLMPPKAKLTLWYKDGQFTNIHRLDDIYSMEKDGWRKIIMEEVDQ